jgi:hypothetical protein
MDLIQQRKTKIKKQAANGRHEKKNGRPVWEKRNLDIKEWYFVKLLSLWSCKLQHVCSLLFKDCLEMQMVMLLSSYNFFCC